MMPSAGNAGRLADQRDLARALDHPHRVEDRIEILDGCGWRLLLHASHEPSSRDLRPSQGSCHATARVRASRAGVPRPASRRGTACRRAAVSRELPATCSELVARQDPLDARQLRRFRSPARAPAPPTAPRARCAAARTASTTSPGRRSPESRAELRRRSGRRTGCSAGTCSYDGVSVAPWITTDAVADLLHHLRPPRGEFLRRQRVGEERRLCRRDRGQNEQGQPGE